jgi:glycosyltransferase involved in cell wall biosynthesis
VRNEAAYVGTTIAEVVDAAARSPFEPEVIVVDDGSNDDTSAIAAQAGAHVIRQENRGRLEARRAGLAAADGDFVLFLDSRVSIERDALAFVAESLSLGEVWNGHAITETAGNPYGRFWDVVSAVAFARYLDAPETTSFGPDEFDAFPKGTTCFFAPRQLLVDAFQAVQTRYADPRYANDDTPLIRWIAGRRRIWISPRFACFYRPRRSLKGFVRHAFHRGIVFLDGHGRRDSRYLPVVLAFYPVSAALVLLAVWWPLSVLLVAALVAVLAALAAMRKRVPAAHVFSFALLAPVYAVAHGLGMWRALALRRR